MYKLLSRVENYIEVTNAKMILGDGCNVLALMNLYENYCLSSLGGFPFWQKMESMLEDQLAKKKYELPKGEVMNMMRAMA